jgi:L-alanine-DL-glutamate epimerase-like enolase superfamily enzyme
MPVALPVDLKVEVTVETWPIAGTFTISRGAKREAAAVVAQVSDGTHLGRGECCPYTRYGETVEGVRQAIVSAGRVLGELPSRAKLIERMPAGAARNALDCALWDWETKRAGTCAAALAGLPALRPVTTAYTISLGAPEEMAAKAAAARSMPLLKLKLGGVAGNGGDAERLRRVRAACPGTRLIADANEAWTPEVLPELMAVAAETGIELVEQPLPAGADAALAEIGRRVPVCADESLHTRAELADLARRYDAVNIKLDKAGGLTEALALAAAARAAGLRIMVGCMVATSLAMAPALLLAQNADWVDLDGPLLLARDRHPGLVYDGALIHPPPPELWG